MDYLLNKSVLLSGLEGKQTALDFIAKSPLKEADKQALIHSLSEFEFRQFGETWRAKHDALVANGQTETNTTSNTFKKRSLCFWLDTWRQARRHWDVGRLSF